MKRMGGRAAALLLALCMALWLLAGCSGGKGDGQQLSATVYVPSYLDVDLDISYLGSGCSDGSNIYLIGYTENQTKTEDPETGEVYYNYESVCDLYRVPLDGSPAGRLPGYVRPAVPEGKSGDAYIERLETGADGTLWVTETVNVWGSADDKYPETPAFDSVARMETAATADAVAGAEVEPEYIEDYDYTEPQTTTVRRQLDSDGNELTVLDLSDLDERLEELLDEDSYFGGRYFDGSGNLFVMTSKDIYVLDPQLNLLFTLEGDEDAWWYNLTLLGDGNVGVPCNYYDEEAESSSYRMKIVDMQAQDWGEELLLPFSAYEIYAGGGDYLFYYRINDSVFGWRKDAPEGTDAGERLFSWIEADINSSEVEFFCFLPDGRVAAVIRSWGEEEPEVNAVLMTATPRDQLPEKTTLTYATMYFSYDARKRIIDFNKTSDAYRIEVRDYSEYNTNDDYSAGLQKLNTEIVAGQLPDILDTSGLPMRQYGAKGVFEDLWPFIEKDPDLGRDGVMERPLQANEQDGKLYEVFKQFAIQTAVGAESVVGDRNSWTLADLNAALATMPEGCSILGMTDTKSGVLQMLMSQNMDNFVDWDSGECYFDSDNFKALLEFCTGFPDEFDWEEWQSSGERYEDDGTRVASGKQMLIQGYISEFDWDIQYYDGIFGGKASFVGYPREDGGVGSAFTISSGLAMSSTCKDKDGAWSFIRQLLLPDEDMYMFPVNRAAFEQMKEREMTQQYQTDENGEPILDEEGQPIPVYEGHIWISEDIQVDMHPATQEEVDRIMALYNAIDTIYRYDEDIYDIIEDVTGSYFAGDRGLDEAASLIQNRVSLYVNESR